MAHLKEGTINQENIGLNNAFLLNMEMFEKRCVGVDFE